MTTQPRVVFTSVDGMDFLAFDVFDPTPSSFFAADLLADAQVVAVVYEPGDRLEHDRSWTPEIGRAHV